MRPLLSGMERKRRSIAMVATGLVIVVVAGVGSYPFWKPKNDPRVITVLPPMMKFMPRSAFQSKPWIDIPWLGGKRLQYPPLSAMPKGFVDDPAMSGIITWEEPKGAPAGIAATFPGGISQIGAVFFNSGSWVDQEGNQEELMTRNNLLMGGLGSASKPYSPLPYVYGDLPKRYTVRWLDFSIMFSGAVAGPPPIVSTEIELPPNHQPAPVGVPSEIQLGKEVVRFTPLSGSGPGFLQKYRVEVKDRKPGQIYFIEILNGLSELGMAPSNLILDDQAPTVYSGQPTKGEKSIILRKVQLERFEVTVRQRSAPKTIPSTSRQFDIIDEKGRSIAVVYESGGVGAVIPKASISGRLDVSIVGYDRTQNKHLHVESQLAVITSATNRTPVTIKLKDAQKLRALGYRQISMEMGKLRLP